MVEIYSLYLSQKCKIGAQGERTRQGVGEGVCFEDSRWCKVRMDAGGVNPLYTSQERHPFRGT